LNILLVEDDKKIRTYIARFLQRLGHQVIEHANGKEALGAFTIERFSMVLTDVKMPVMSGIELLRAIIKMPENERPDVVLFTGHGNIDDAIEALRCGAFDYLAKPINLEDLVVVINRVAEHQSLKNQNDNFDPINQQIHAETDHQLNHIEKILAQTMNIGKIGFFSESICQTIKLARQYHENRDLPVLIEGETGTGKELIARAIHYGDMQEEGPFIDINCAAISANLFESELFGYEGGSFTNASSKGRKGKLDLAKGGTLFLDEISELPIDLQAKLLRVIQEKEFYRVGGLEKIKTDIRLICATNLSLAERVDQGAFRRDLYYRLKVGHIFVPPLREREKDTISLGTMFLQEFSRAKGKKFSRINEIAQKMLLAHSWPGNVRELRNLMEWIVAMYDDEELKPIHLSALYPPNDTYPEKNNKETYVLEPFQFTLPPEGFSLHEFIDKIILEALEMHQGNKAAAARYLKCSRRTIYYLLDKVEHNNDATN